jgi:serine phosphatase RsbU (regulator of sigma subunit)/HPt (histidine-containing phosphotransfer) domain-containing protein
LRIAALARASAHPARMAHALHWNIAMLSSELSLPDTSAHPETMADESKPRLLIVDDDEDMRMLLSAWLEPLGYPVSTVPDGEAALQWLESDMADVVFLDLAMGGMNGLDVLKHIRDSHFDVAVVLTTASGSEDVAIAALRIGADDYLRKPFNQYDLQAVLDRATRKLALSRHNEDLQRQLGVELSRAAEMQADLLPADPPELAGWEVCARCVPARQVGGDFYDWHQPAPGILSVTVGDVMGKGLSAALLMASVRAVLRAVGPYAAPASAVQTAAASLQSDLTRSGSFVTVFHGQLDLVTGRLRYVDAGHGYALVCRANGTMEPLPAEGLPIGVLDEEVYSEGEVTIGPGDVVIIYSDGLTQALPEALTSPERAAFVAQQGSALAIAEDLINRATAAGPLADDLTISVLRRCADAASIAANASGAEDQSPIVAHVDAVLQPLLPTFLTRRRQDVTLIKQELQRGGFRAIQTIGHNLKGIGSSYGFHGISEIGKAMEAAAEQQDASAIRRQAKELDEYLRRVRLEV